MKCCIISFVFNDFWQKCSKPSKTLLTKTQLPGEFVPKETTQKFCCLNRSRDDELDEHDEIMHSSEKVVKRNHNKNKYIDRSQNTDSLDG